MEVSTRALRCALLGVRSLISGRGRLLLEWGNDIETRRARL